MYIKCTGPIFDKHLIFIFLKGLNGKDRHYAFLRIENLHK